MELWSGDHRSHQRQVQGLAEVLLVPGHQETDEHRPQREDGTALPGGPRHALGMLLQPEVVLGAGEAADTLVLDEVPVSSRVHYGAPKTPKH